MLRGPQTLGELKQRTERMQSFASLEEVETTLQSLAERELAAQLPRRPGQKEQRYVQLLGGESPAETPAPTERSHDSSSLEARVERLEEQVAELMRRLSPAQPL
jgi:uncharacterized protein YceH (UPF0502 family)